MAGGGARVPFSLLDVEMGFDVEAPVLYVRNGDRPPAVRARIAYNGTGRLRGRWEVVMPGEELPSSRDLLTEATLPFEERGTQRRYTEIGRFNVFLPRRADRSSCPAPIRAGCRPAPKASTTCCCASRRATTRKATRTSRAQARARVSSTRAPSPASRCPPSGYVVGGERTTTLDGGAPGDLRLLAPVDEAVVLSGDLDLAWLELPQADVYRVEMADQAGQVLLSALVQRGVSAYRAPPFLKERAPGGQVRWRVVAIDVTGRELRSSVWRRLRVE